MDQSSNKDILNEEIKSWEGFEYALREENRLLLGKMLSECKENEDYISNNSHFVINISCKYYTLIYRVGCTAFPDFDFWNSKA